MAIKELKTRIALKYDSYSAWTSAPGKDLVLLAGELGICHIGDANQGSNVVPTVLFKVGDGTKTFEALPWASAKAADVYSWAKASEVKRDGKKLVFVGGGADGSNVEVAFDYVTLAEVKEITDGLNTRITAIEGKFGEAGSVTTELASLDSRLDTIEGEGAGSIKKAEADAKAYADSLAGNYDANGSAAAAESAAKSYADTEIAKDRKRLDDLETADAAQDTLIANNKKAIEDEVVARGTAINGVTTAFQAADTAINNKIGTVADGKTVVGMISEAQTAAATDAQNKVDALANGQVATNKTDIAGLTTRIGNEETARANADTALDNRLKKVETFFEKAEGETISEALDTLVEIQTYITGEGAAADEMVKDIAANAEAITALQNIVKDGGTLEVRVDDAQTRVAAVEGRATTLEKIVQGYTDEGSVKTAIEAAASAASVADGKAVAAQTAADNAQDAAEAADAKAVQAQNEVDALETVVAGVKETADNAKTDLAALTGRVTTAEGKITTAEGKITTLEGIVNDASKGNDKLRSDVNALQTLTGAGGAIELAIADAKKAGTDAAKAVDDLSKGQVATNKTDIANIKADYLKAADEFIFNCGTATTITHKAD